MKQSVCKAVFFLISALVFTQSTEFQFLKSVADGDLKTGQTYLKQGIDPDLLLNRPENTEFIEYLSAKIPAGKKDKLNSLTVMKFVGYATSGTELISLSALKIAVRLLIKNGAEVNGIKVEVHTPLMVAGVMDSYEAAAELIKQKADVNKVCPYGSTQM